MLGIRKTIGSIIMIVLFLVLAYLAAFSYSPEQNKKDNPATNFFVEKSRTILGYLVGAAESVVNVNLQKNVGPSKTVIDNASKINWQSLAQNASQAFNGESKNDNSDNSGTKTNINSDTGGDFNNVSENSDSSATKKTTSFWSKLVTTVKEDLANTETPNIDSQETSSELPLVNHSADNLDSLESDFINYQKTEEGAEIIFRSKTGEEYKLPLPFKFLSKF